MYRKHCDYYSDPNYNEYLIEYRGDFHEEISKVSYACGDILNRKFAIISVKSTQLNQLLIDVPSILFVNFRNMYVLESTSAESTSNFEPYKLNPYLLLSGTGVIVGIVDTGIDYLNKEFILENGISRIETIWDQSAPTTTDESVFIGASYSNEQINKALDASRENKDPYEIVPSKDTIGHGTKLAGIIGARGYNNEFRGIAHDCTFAIVKLLESASFKRDLMLNGINVPVYNNSEIVAGLEYLRQYAAKVHKPIIILLGLGATDYSHDGTTLFSRYVNDLATYRGLVVVTGTGNEADSEGHTSGNILNTGEIKTSELKIVQPLNNLTFRIWIRKSNKFDLNVISPSGQSSKFINTKIKYTEKINYLLEDTSLTINFYVPDNITGLQVIKLSFSNIKPGIWSIQLRGDYVTDGRYDIWLPPAQTLPPDTKFLRPDPNNTLTIPSAAKKVIAVGYYNQTNNSIASASGNGYPLNSYIKPDVVAPGINILTTSINNSITTISGSSAAAAIAAGACALLVQWGIVDKNDPTMYSTKIISYLITGASRINNYVYPNQFWGYGVLDFNGIFNTLTGKRLFLENNYIEYYVNNLFVRLPKRMEDISYEQEIF